MTAQFNELYIKTEEKDEPDEVPESDASIPLPKSAAKKPAKNRPRITGKDHQQSFICKVCNIVIDTKQKYSSHMKIHRDPEHQCATCARRFKSLKNMEKHECAICRVCGENFPSKGDLKRHMKQLHAEAAAAIYFVTCDFCGKELKTKTYLIHHMRAEHVKDAATQQLCSLCGSNFANKFMLNAHMKIAHAEMVACKLCSKLVKPLCMPYHMRQVHASERNFLCTICSAAFKTKDNLKDHLKVHEKSIACEICEKRFSRRFQYNEHMTLHKNPNAFTCSTCGHRFSTASYLKRHMRAHESGNVRCRICGVDVNRLSLHYHMKNVHPLDRFSCGKCHASGFASAKEFNEHLRQHERERVEAEAAVAAAVQEEERRKRAAQEREREEQQVLAREEEAKARSEEALVERRRRGGKRAAKPVGREAEEVLEVIEEHLQEEHELEGNCGYGDYHEHALDDHQYFDAPPEQLPMVKTEEALEAIHRASPHRPETFDMFVCDIVPRRRRRRTAPRKPRDDPPQRSLKLPKHATVVCDLCGEDFDQKPKLAAHLRRHAAERETFACGTCAKVFPNKYCLAQHLKSHDDTLAECQMCGKRVKPLCMSSHVKQVHTNYRTMACTTCGKVFKTKQNLRDHVKSHEKSFQCEVCGRNFSHRSQMNEHMMWHETPEAFDCPVCGMRLKDKRILKKHVRNVHEGGGARGANRERPFKCDRCDYACSQKGNLKVHQRKHERYEAKLRLNPDSLTCATCGAICGNEQLMRMHVQKVHSDERFPCGHCEAVLKTKTALWAHWRRIHQIEPERARKREKGEGEEGERAKKQKRRRRRKRNELGELVEREEPVDAAVELKNVVNVSFY